VSDPGLLPVDNLDAFPELWRYFSDDRLGEADRHQLLLKIKSRLFSPRPRIKFLGAFDTVAGSSWDLLNLFSMVRFKSLHLDEYLDAAVQILAIDDDRNPSFKPLLWDKKADPAMTKAQSKLFVLQPVRRSGRARPPLPPALKKSTTRLREAATRDKEFRPSNVMEYWFAPMSAFAPLSGRSIAIQPCRKVP
jgi:hypothetical protein